MVARHPGRFLASAALAAALAAGVLAGCSGNGASASCSTNQCTITFQRDVANAGISILGVEVQVVSATDEQVTLKVAGRDVTISKGEGVNVGDLSIKVTEITQEQIVVEATRGSGN